MRSISRAAAALDITQPAASGHIRTIEEQIGRKLFRRHARGVDALAAADELAASVGPSLEGVDETFAAMRARSKVLAGTLRLAGPSEFLRACMVVPIEALTTAGLNVRLVLGGKTIIYEALRTRAADIAITASRPKGAELGFKKIAQEELLPVASPGWSAAELGSEPRLIDALDKSLVAYGEELPLIAKVLDHAGIDISAIRPTIVAPDLRMVRDLVEANAGWSVLPDYLVSDSLGAGRLIRLNHSSRAIKNALYLVWPKQALRHNRVAFARDSIVAHFCD